jgi:hypothetical protein
MDGKHKVELAPLTVPVKPFEIVDQALIDLVGGLGECLERGRVAPVNADGDPLELLELQQLKNVVAIGHTEIGTEGVASDFRVRLEVLELAEQAAVHEDAAGAGRKLDPPISHLRRLFDAAFEQLLRHHGLGALLLGVGAEAAVEVAEARRLDVDQIAGRGNQFLPFDAIYVDHERLANISQKLLCIVSIHQAPSPWDNLPVLPGPR